MKNKTKIKHQIRAKRQQKQSQRRKMYEEYLRLLQEFSVRVLKEEGQLIGNKRRDRQTIHDYNMMARAELKKHMTLEQRVVYLRHELSIAPTATRLVVGNSTELEVTSSEENLTYSEDGSNDQEN